MRFKISVFTLFILFYAHSSFAVPLIPGDLDPKFGTAGIVTTSSNGFNETSNAVIVQPDDGKIIVAGSTQVTGTAKKFALVRYNSDGTVDPTFGTDANGIVILDASNGNGDSEINAIALQDKNIIVAGFATTTRGDTDFALARFDSSGKLDTTFGTNGIVTTDIFNDKNKDVIHAMLLQPSDGKILVAGTEKFNNTDSDIAFARYDKNGNLDNTFGALNNTGIGSGMNTIAMDLNLNGIPNPSNNVDVAKAMVLQKDGKIILVGSVSNFVAIVRLNSDGGFSEPNNDPLDVTFGNNTGGLINRPGVLLLPAIPGELRSVALQSVGNEERIVSGGFNAALNFLLIRCGDKDCKALDSSFGNNGLQTTKIGEINFLSSLAIQSDGKIVASGTSSNLIPLPSPHPDTRFAVTRYDINGHLDLTFHGEGKVTTAVEISNFRTAAILQPDGKIIVSGTSSPDKVNDNFALARYIGNSADLKLEATSSANGEDITYHFTLTNNGPDNADQVTLNDPLPGATSFISATPSQGTCNNQNPFVCNVGSLKKDEKATVTLIVKSSNPGKFSNSATVAVMQSASDPDESNNQITLSTDITSLPGSGGNGGGGCSINTISRGNSLWMLVGLIPFAVLRRKRVKVS